MQFFINNIYIYIHIRKYKEILAKNLIHFQDQIVENEYGLSL